MIRRNSIDVFVEPISLNWYNGELTDWISGNVYKSNGEVKNNNVHFGYRFDAAKQSANGVYVVIYERLGTKGLILKNGEVIREINRSYYCAGSYEYPIEIFKLRNNNYAIVHCPQDYNLIEIELIESGEKLTSITDRKPDDCFHSRFAVNYSNTYFLNAGWVWHPYGILQLYDIERGLSNNDIFDKLSFSLPICGEVCSAAFLDNDLFIVSSTEEDPLNHDLERNDMLKESQIGLFSISQNRFIKKCSVDFKVGTIIPINEDVVFDLYDIPKLIDINSGKVLQKFVGLNSGKQDSSIIHSLGKVPPFAFTHEPNWKIAVGIEKSIEIFEWVNDYSLK